MVPENAGPTDLVVDPSLPAEARRLLERKWSGSGNPAGAAAGCAGLAASVMGLIVTLVLQFTDGLSWWWVSGSAVGALVALGVIGVVTDGTLDEHDRDRLVESSDMDASCRRLLLRGQHAIRTILSSGVYADELLNHAVDEKVLRRHEWDIAIALRDISGLSSELKSNTADGPPGPKTAAVLDSHQRALTLARNATTSRIIALERFAAQVEAADSAKRDWKRALEVSGINDKYLDLVAQTAADELAIAEITDMTEQAAAAAGAFRDSLHEASLAAEALALPALPQA